MNYSGKSYGRTDLSSILREQQRLCWAVVFFFFCVSSPLKLPVLLVSFCIAVIQLEQ